MTDQRLAQRHLRGNEQLYEGKPMKVRFFLRHGVMVEWPVPDPKTFSFQLFCVSIRATGRFLVDDVYIPGDEIAFIGLDGGTARVVHPAPAAKQ